MRSSWTPRLALGRQPGLVSAALGLIMLPVSVGMISTGAAAHESWINQQNAVDPVTKQSCCGDYDCALVPATRIKVVPGGYFVIDTGETIPESRALPSPDGEYWRCRMRASDPYSATRCFFRGLPGT